MKTLFALILTVLLTSFAFAADHADEAALRAMPLRKKIGQMLVVGFNGKTIDEGLSETLTKVAPGGLIIFNRNIDSAAQLSELLYRAQKFSKTPLLIGTDQEGGDVLRIKTAMPLPSALAFGHANDRALTESAGLATGQLLKTLGFNMNFAPVIDVADPRGGAFIGTRTYGTDPELVSKMGVSFATGLVKAGVLPIGKHFPGHGGVNEDSHVETPEKNAGREELEERDLAPFRAMKSAFGTRVGVMLAHVAYPALDPSGLPATLSKPIVTGLLRDEMKFDGIVVTDDISMTGAAAVKSIRERAIRAVEAGSDMIMVAWNSRLQAEIVTSIENAVKSGRIKPARIDASVRRILAAKRYYANSTSRRATPEELRLAVRNPRFGEIGEGAIRARFQRELDPEEVEVRNFVENKPVLVFSANVRFGQGFKAALKNRSVQVHAIDVDQPHDIDRIMRANPRAVGVFYVSGFQAARVASTIGEDAAKRIILVSIEAKSTMKNAESFRYIAGVYYRHPDLGHLIANHYFVPEASEIRQPATASRR